MGLCQLSLALRRGGAQRSAASERASHRDPEQERVYVVADAVPVILSCNWQSHGATGEDHAAPGCQVLDRNQNSAH
eukprot:scaffold77099_cov30-Tisochrysis_lutea.AAC.3